MAFCRHCGHSTHLLCLALTMAGVCSKLPASELQSPVQARDRGGTSQACQVQQQSLYQPRQCPAMTKAGGHDEGTPGQETQPDICFVLGGGRTGQSRPNVGLTAGLGWGWDGEPGCSTFLVFFSSAPVPWGLGHMKHKSELFSMPAFLNPTP